jgi:hypothetical protein
MLRLLSRLAGLMLLVLLPLAAGGCADSLPARGPVARFTDLMKNYDKTLTREQQQAAIAELQANAKHQDAPGTAQGGTTASVTPPASPGN